MGRRELIVAMLQALLLALLPWLRTERGLVATKRAVDATLPAALDYGSWIDQAYMHFFQHYELRWER